MYMNIENSEYDFSRNTYIDSAGVQRTEYIKNITAQQMYDCMIHDQISEASLSNGREL